MVIASAVNAQSPIQEFNFDATLLNTTNNITFMGSPTYVSDRFGVANRALRLNNSDVEAVISDLPQNSGARTVSLWVKFNDVADANYVWGYGTTYSSQYFGLIHQGVFNGNSNLSLAGWGPSNDVITSTDLATNTWYNYVITFNGETSNIYRNGELIKSDSTPERFTKGTVFRFGKINTTVSINADFDDLKIFNLALTGEQVSKLYLDEKPSVLIVSESKVKTTTTSKGSTKVVAKAPVAVPATELVSNNPKAIEIFSQGQKVLGSTKQAVNISDLPEGTYLLKISAVPSKKATAY